MRSMQRATRIVKALVASAALALSFITPISPASSDVLWVSAPTWANLHVKTEDGVFERAKREFDTSSKLMVDSETQHNIAWVRTDRNNVTAQYIGGVANAGKKVQFILSGDAAFTDSIEGDENIAITDENGVAEVTITLTNEPVEEDTLQVGLSTGEGDSISTLGNMGIVWQPEGFFPIIKLVGTGQGFESNCTYRKPAVAGDLSATNLPFLQGAVGHAHECLNGDLQEYTWAWSVFKKDWLPEYSQVYVKSYKYGSNINLKYKVTDIWGTPLAEKSIYLVVDLGCRLCKWGSYETDKETDENGYVEFSVPNRNSLSSVKNNAFTNSDTKARESGFIAFSIQPTTNEIDESADFIWPQLVTDINIKSTASRLTVISRGGNDVNSDGNYVTTVDGNQVINPAQTVDTTDQSLTDISVVNFQITFSKNALNKALYSPDVKVTADNGGKAAIIDASRPLANLADSAKFSSPLVFSYTYIQKIALMCTKTGVTTFKITTGSDSKTFTMTCKNAISDARFISPVAGGTAVPTVANKATFKVTDRWGSGVAGVTVRLSTSGNGEMTSAQDLVTDANGIVAADVTATAVGDQVVTATIQDSGTQVAEAADEVKGIAAGNAETTNTVVWGAEGLTLTPGTKKVTMTFYNQQGKRATFYDGRKKSYINVTSPLQVIVKKISGKGKHSIRVLVGTLTKTTSVTVK